jgi:hypothetical protein
MAIIKLSFLRIGQANLCLFYIFEFILGELLLLFINISVFIRMIDNCQLFKGLFDLVCSRTLIYL